MTQITMRHIPETSSGKMQKNNACFNSVLGDLYTYKRSESKLI